MSEPVLTNRWTEIGSHLPGEWEPHVTEDHDPSTVEEAYIHPDGREIWIAALDNGDYSVIVHDYRDSNTVNHMAPETLLERIKNGVMNRRAICRSAAVGYMVGVEEGEDGR